MAIPSFVGRWVRAALALVAAGWVLQIPADASARNGPIPSEVFAVFQKSGTELIINLGDHDEFTQVTVPAATIQSAFGSTSLAGTSLAVVGTFDENLTVTVGSSVLPRANLLFSTADANPKGLDDAKIITAFNLLTSGTTGFIDGARSIPVGGAAVRLASAPDSFQSAAGGDTFGGAFPFMISVPVAAAGAITPVFGAAQSVQPQNGGPPREIEAVLPLRIAPNGVIARLVPSDLKSVASRLYLVLTKGGVEVVFNLGDHDNLAVKPVQLGAAGIAQLGGNLVGASVALVGVFDENLRVRVLGGAFSRSNIMFSSPNGTGPTPLADTQITQAFNSLTAGTTGFLDTVPALVVGAGAVLPAANSFGTKFGPSAQGKFGFSVIGSVGASGVNVPLTGAAIAVQPTIPGGAIHEVEQIQLITITPGGLVSAIHTI